MPLALQALLKAPTVEMVSAATGADGRRFGRVLLEADGAFGVCDRKQALLLLLRQQKSLRRLLGEDEQRPVMMHHRLQKSTL